MKKFYKYMLAIGGALAFLFFLLRIITITTFSGPSDKHVTREETIENFTKHETDIMYFSDLFLSKKPSEHEISFSIHGNKGYVSIGMRDWSVDQRFPNHHFDFKISSVDENAVFLRELGWDIQTLKNVVAAFRKTNCQSAMTNDGTVELGFKTGTWTSFSYRIGPTPMDDSTRIMYETNGIQVLNNRARIGRGSAL